MLDLVVNRLYTSRIQLGYITIHNKIQFIKNLDYNANNYEYIHTEINVIKQLIQTIPNEDSRRIYEEIAKKQLGDLYVNDNKG